MSTNPFITEKVTVNEDEMDAANLAELLDNKAFIVQTIKDACAKAKPSALPELLMLLNEVADERAMLLGVFPDMED